MAAEQPHDALEINTGEKYVKLSHVQFLYFERGVRGDASVVAREWW
jgi:hypothetical protein